MISTTKIAVFVALLSTSASFASAQDESRYPIPITVGHLGIPHGYLMVAWTPTKTTMGDVCNSTSTRVVLQSVQTNRPSNPLCGRPFEIDGIKNLQLLCDETETTQEIPTGISTDGQKTHNCTSLPLEIYSTPCGVGAALSQSYACQ